MLRKNNRWKILLLGVLLLLLGGVVGFLLSPVAPVKDASKVTELRVKRVTEGKEEDISTLVDADALKAILPLMRAGKIPAMSEPTMMKDYRFEIDGIYDNKPLHIVLGENGVSCVYSSGNRDTRKLQNPESWIAVMEKLAEQ